MTGSIATSAAPTRAARFLNLARRALVAEIRVYTSIARAIARRPAVSDGATGVSYHAPVLTVLFIFIGLSSVCAAS